MSESKIIILYKQNVSFSKQGLLIQWCLAGFQKHRSLQARCVYVRIKFQGNRFFSGLRFLYQRFQPFQPKIFSYLFGLLCCFLCRVARIDSAKQESRTDWAACVCLCLRGDLQWDALLVVLKQLLIVLFFFFFLANIERNLCPAFLPFPLFLLPYYETWMISGSISWIWNYYV